MPEDFDNLLSAIATSAGAAARPHGPDAARRRGAQRTLRRRLAVSALSAVLLAGGIGTALAVSRSGGGPAPASPVVSSSGRPSPDPSPTPSRSAGSSDAAPTLSLQLPTALAKATANQVGFTVTNPGPARTETVTLDLGRPASGAPSSTTPLERGIVQRQDGPGGAWVTVPVSYTSTGSASGTAADTATYQLALPARADVQEHLRVTPVGVESVDFAVRLTGGSAPVTRSQALPLATPRLTGTGPASVTPGTTSAEFDFTLSNITTADYSAVGLYLNAGGSTSNCTFAPFATAQWWDGTGWRNVSLSSGWPSLETVGLGAGQSLTLRTRLIVPATLDSCLKRGQVSMIAATGGLAQNGGSTAAPQLGVRGDAPFFSIG
ncbi:hypothetical protein [Streptacidiphilus sp. EB103A]|uniref:hypothetical protein n=1 Tax=Streptacidiphilus sp. EB103A TaxID=3156275 RepID=UPI00351935A7